MNTDNIQASIEAEIAKLQGALDAIKGVSDDFEEDDDDNFNLEEIDNSSNKAKGTSAK